MLSKRIIACLDVKDGRVVKGVRFKGHEVVGEILDLAQRYSQQGIDELVFYDISASADGRRVDRKWVEDVARVINIPFSVAGGIRSLEDARTVLHSGADKISVNSPALESPQLISDLAKEFGQQCVVVGVDSYRQDSDYQVHWYTGSEHRAGPSGKCTMDWISEAQERGAGEIVLNCMNQDGTGSGYDIEQLSKARALLSIPLVASGGARSAAHFVRVFREAKVDAALAAGAFHRKEIVIAELKSELSKEGIEVRL